MVAYLLSTVKISVKSGSPFVICDIVADVICKMLKIIIGRGKIIRFHRLFLRSYCCTDDLQFDKFSRIRGGK